MIRQHQQYKGGEVPHKGTASLGSAPFNLTLFKQSTRPLPIARFALTRIRGATWVACIRVLHVIGDRL